MSGHYEFYKLNDVGHSRGIKLEEMESIMLKWNANVASCFLTQGRSSSLEGKISLRFLINRQLLQRHRYTGIGRISFSHFTEKENFKPARWAATDRAFILAGASL